MRVAVASNGRGPVRSPYTERERSVNRVLKVASAGGVALALMIPTSVSFASTTADSPTQQEVEEATDFLRDAGVKASTATNLIKAVKRGEPVGSAAGLVATSQSTEREGDWVITTEVFPDGSVEVTSLEQPPAPDGLTDAEFEAGGDILDTEPSLPPIRAMDSGVETNGAEATGSIVGCKVSSGSGYRSYKGCAVRRQSAMAVIAFNASYTIVQKGNDYISSIGQAAHRCYVSSCSDVKSRLIRKKESSSGKAVARGSMNITLKGGVASKSYWVELRVGGNKAGAVNGG